MYVCSFLPNGCSLLSENPLSFSLHNDVTCFDATYYSFAHPRKFVGVQQTKPTGNMGDSECVAALLIVIWNTYFNYEQTDTGVR